jgi:hypothetical protein
MSETKQIKFSFVVDQGSAREVDRVLNQMIEKAKELGKTLQGVGGGGGLLGGVRTGSGTPSPQSTLAGKGGSVSQKTSFTQILGGSAEGFKKLANESGMAMKAMTDALQRATSQQQREVDKLTASLDKLGQRYEKLGGGAMTGSAIVAKTRQLSAAREELNRLKEMDPNRRELMPEVPYPGQESAQKRGMFGRAKDWLGEKGIYSGAGGGGLIQGFAPQGIGGWLRMGGMVVAGADAAFSEARSGTRAFNEAEANRGRLVNRRIRASKGGDVSDLMALQMMGGMARDDLAKQTGGTGADAEAFISGIKKMVSRTAGAVTGGFLGEKGGNILGGMTTAEQEQMKAENMFRQIDNFKESTQYLRRQMAMEQFEGSLSGRISATQMMGRTFRNKRDGRTGKALEGIFEDSYSNREADLVEKGFSTAQEQAAFSQVMGIAGKKVAGRRAYEVMSAAAAGYGGYGNLVGISERMGTDNLARYAIGGGIEKGAGIELGSALLGTGFSPEGMTDRLGTLGALQKSGIFSGGAGDFIGVQQAMAGLSLGSAITTGQTSPYQRGANVLAAINAGAGNTYLQDYLGNQMSLEKKIDVAYGGSSDATLAALGGDDEMVRKSIGGQLDAAISTLYDKGLEGTQAGKTLSKFRESGMSLDAFLQDAGKDTTRAGEISDLGILLGQSTGKGQEAGVALARIISGTGGAAEMGAVGAGKLDDLTSARMKKEADRIREAGQEMANNFKQITETMKISGGWEKSLQSFGENLSGSAEILRESFTNLADAATQAAYKLNPSGNYGGQSKAPANSKAGAPQGKK